MAEECSCGYLSPTWVKLTMVLVTLVPMLAPMIMGMATRTGTSAATRPTMMEVEVEEDWTSTVTRTPIITPTIGFPSRSELEKKAEGDVFFIVKVFLPCSLLFQMNSYSCTQNFDKQSMT